MERIVLLGPPASGKGTQGRKLGSELGLPVVSTGQMLRAEELRGTEIGHLSVELSKTGTLLPDEAILELVAHWTAENGARFVFDGFPRTLPQAEAFTRFLDGVRSPIELVIHFDLPEAQARDRVVGRLTCVHCGRAFAPAQAPSATGDRPGGPVDLVECPDCGERLVRRRDDAGEVFAMRMHQYRERTAPLVDYYRGLGTLRTVDASLDPQQVSNRLGEVLAGTGTGCQTRLSTP